MTAEEAEKMSIERKPVWEKEVFYNQIKEVYDAIEVSASMGRELVYGNNVYGVKEGYIPLKGILPSTIVDKLRRDGFYVRSEYIGTFNSETIVAWGNEVIRIKEQDCHMEIDLSQQKQKHPEPKQSFIKRIWSRISKTILGG